MGRGGGVIPTPRTQNTPRRSLVSVEETIDPEAPPQQGEGLQGHPPSLSESVRLATTPAQPTNIMHCIVTF